jgi:hypothetical protein
MRRHDMVSGILLILSIIDLALAAPVLVQEKRHACVDAVHIPTDVITVLGKRGLEGLEHVLEYFNLKTWGKPIESSDAHASTSSAPPRPDYASTSSAPPRPASQKEFGQAYTSGYPVEHVQQPNPGPSADDFDWNYWMNLEDPSPPRLESPKPSNSKPSTKSGFNWKYWANPLNLMDPLTQEGRQALSKPSNPKPSTKSGFSWNWQDLLSKLDPLPRPGWSQDSKPLNPKPSDQGPLNPGLRTPRPPLKIAPSPSPELTPPSEMPNLGSPKEPEDEAVPGPPSSLDSELHSDDQSSTADSQPDLLAAIYAAKGKAKESRRISGTARDVGNAAQR